MKVSDDGKPVVQEAGDWLRSRAFEKFQAAALKVIS